MRDEVQPQHRELRALLFSNSVWVLLRPTELSTLKGCEARPTGPTPTSMLSFGGKASEVASEEFDPCRKYSDLF